MPKQSSQRSSADDIRELLDERETIGQWLKRLAAADEDTPADVRDKVKADYEGRLKDVSRRLQGFTSQLSKSLEQRTRKRTELNDQEAAAEGRLGEAKLRYSVGEYDDPEWNEAQAEFQEKLNSVRDELSALGEEIAELEEVLAAIGEDAASTTAAKDDSEDDADDDAEEEDAEPKTAKAASPKPSAKRKKAKAPAEQTDSFDEMEFLKTLGDKKKKAPAPTGASFKRAGDAKRGAGNLASKTGSRERRGSRSSLGATAKSLKCAECGVLNLPTEWYCENCGAELSEV